VLLGVLQYAAFGLLDSSMVPESAAAAMTVRAIVCSLLLSWIGFSFSGVFNSRTMQPALALVPLIAGAGVAALALVAQDPSGYYDYYAGLMLVLFYVHALLRLRFLWATAVSVIIIAMYSLTTAFFLVTPTILLINNTFFLLSANATGMVVSYALEYYARRIYLNTQTLKEQRHQLELEGARKSRELEAARGLQLNSLPTAIPDHPAAEWAASMRPAAEVGGDYYDWMVSPDGAVTIAIGDATGHGVQAGALVTAAQTVFSSFRDEPDLGVLLQRAHVPLRRVGNGRLFMALAVARLRGDELALAGAGMPPAVIVRADGSCQQIALKGLPLGSHVPYPYQSVTVTLAPGDTVIFMTDGLPELFNPEGEMFGYDRATSLAESVADAPPAAVVRRLHAAAKQWRGDRLPNDDVTFLVIKRRALPVLMDKTGSPPAVIEAMPLR